MTFFLLTFFCLTIFAANSIFCRFAIMVHDMGPLQYTGVRGLSAALILAALCLCGGIQPRPEEDEHPKSLRSGTKCPAVGRQPWRVFRDAWQESTWPGALWLFLYMLCFSLAYVAIPSAPGTLVLNVCVVFGMVGLEACHGIFPDKKQYLGFATAAAGLVLLLSPGLTAPPLLHALIMAGSGFAWVGFTVYGRTAHSAALAIAGTFWRAALFGALCMLCGLVLEGEDMVPLALLFALAGGLASSLGYILWYALVPRFSSCIVISLLQLAIPAITAIMGALFLAEPVTLRLVFASILILGGIALALRAKEQAKECARTDEDRRCS